MSSVTSLPSDALSASLSAATCVSRQRLGAGHLGGDLAAAAWRAARRKAAMMSGSGEEAPVAGDDLEEIADRPPMPAWSSTALDGADLLLGGKDRAPDEGLEIVALVVERGETADIVLEFGRAPCRPRRARTERSHSAPRGSKSGEDFFATCSRFSDAKGLLPGSPAPSLFKALNGFGFPGPPDHAGPSPCPESRGSISIGLAAGQYGGMRRFCQCRRRGEKAAGGCSGAASRHRVRPATGRDSAT